MRVKVLSRNPEDCVRETKKDLHKVPRNYDPSLHPFEAAREYTRALNATKLERVFAKPFLGSLEGHRDSVFCISKHPNQLSTVISGSCDGEVRVWNLPNRTCLWKYAAHDGFVRSMCVSPSGSHFFTCGDDKTIKQWAFDLDGDEHLEDPMNVIVGNQVFIGIDHHFKDSFFATCGQSVNIWDESRSEPIRTYNWGVDSVVNLKYNPIEHHLLGATASDRSILLYDTRGAAPLRKVILRLRSNALAWNPLESYSFTVANEDYNLYTFDMRKLDMPVNVHMDHVCAVLDVDYSPTGKEIVSGSYDKSIRIFPVDQGRSREVYHTKRMQRVQSVQWTFDNKYIISASDEMNLRIWKANASEKLGVLKPREKATFNYNQKLKDKFTHHPEVKRIARHRHVPKQIYNAAKEHGIIKKSQKRKEANRRVHSKPGAVPFVPERKKSVVSQVQ